MGLRARAIALLPAAAAGLAACEMDSRPLMPTWNGEGFDGADVQDLDALPEEERPALGAEDPYVGELGPSDPGAGLYSGATVSFLGTGERVCLIVDPQSVWRDDLQLDATGGQAINPFMDDYPHDDGDVDLLAGLAAYYTGTPGEEIGDFFGSIPDDNDIERAVDFNVCLNEDYFGATGGTAGRGTAEWCSFETVLDVEYRVVLQVFSTPTDDDLLKFAFQMLEGDCPPQVNECTLRGDVDVDADAQLPYGFDDVETMYCDAYGAED